MIYKHTHISEDLSGKDYRNADLSGTLFYNCSLRHTDFTGANLTGCAFPKSDLAHAKLFGAILNLECLIFTGVKLDKTTVLMYLYLATLADIDVQLKSDIESIIGPDVLKKLKKYFDTTGA